MLCYEIPGERTDGGRRSGNEIAKFLRSPESIRRLTNPMISVRSESMTA